MAGERAVVCPGSGQKSTRAALGINLRGNLISKSPTKCGLGAVSEPCLVTAVFHEASAVNVPALGFPWTEEGERGAGSRGEGAQGGRGTRVSRLESAAVVWSRLATQSALPCLPEALGSPPADAGKPRAPASRSPSQLGRVRPAAVQGPQTELGRLCSPRPGAPWPLGRPRGTQQRGCPPSLQSPSVGVRSVP